MTDAPEVGTTAQLNSVLGEGVGFIPSGTEVTVTDVHDSGTPGTGIVEDGKVVRLEFNESTTVINDGKPEQGTIKRAITISQYDYYQLFTESGK